MNKESQEENPAKDWSEKERLLTLSSSYEDSNAQCDY
jgi:hypothetical protein